MALEKDPCGVLAESVADPEGGYIHKCGHDVIGKFVNLTVVGIGPNGSGTGEVIKVEQPCCPPCGIEPPSHGTIDYRELPGAIEAPIIKEL